MSASPRTLALTGLLAALVTGTTGCGIEQLQFRNDERLTFSTPGVRERVTLPLPVEWTMSGFDPVGLDGSSQDDRGVFAVFVDRAPMPVGEDLEWVARDDTSCSRDPRCPSAAYLAEQGVLLTTEPRVVLERLPDVGEGVGDEQHWVNVVLLDGTGTRIGESAWYRPFTTRRTAA